MMQLRQTVRIASALGAILAAAAHAEAPADPTAGVMLPPPPRTTPVPPWGTVIAPPDVPKVRCAVPGAARGRAFYVDPTTGNNASDGSQARPWRTLAEVLADKTPRLAAGDTLYLMDGDHGAPVITGRNSDFVTIRAAPGAHPRVASLRIGGASKWVIDGLTVYGERQGFAALVIIAPGGKNPVDNIVFRNGLVTSTDDSSRWTQDDWQKRAAYWGIRTDSGGDPNGANCIALAHNHITNVLFAIGFGTSNSSITDNLIDSFGGDGIDVAASHIVVARNLITDNIEGGFKNHNDGIQMHAGRFRSYKDVVIDGNTVIRQTRDLPFTSYLQGISAFNSDWFDLTVTNNVVITNQAHGISFGSVHGGRFANNIVLNDGAKAFNYGDTWIKIAPRTHEGFDASDVVVANNIASNIGTVSMIPTIRFTSNITSLAALPVGGKTMWIKPGQPQAGDNRVLSNLASLFVDYAPRKYRFDLRPAHPRDAANWPDRLMAIVGGPAGGVQPGIEGRAK